MSSLGLEIVLICPVVLLTNFFYNQSIFWVSKPRKEKLKAKFIVECFINMRSTDANSFGVPTSLLALISWLSQFLMLGLTARTRGEGGGGELFIIRKYMIKNESLTMNSYKQFRKPIKQRFRKLFQYFNRLKTRYNRLFMLQIQKQFVRQKYQPVENTK